jgi:hypothetical protein
MHGIHIRCPIMEPTINILGSHPIQGFAHGCDHGIKRAGPYLPQTGFHLAKQLFDGRLVRTPRGQRLHPRSYRSDGLDHLGILMRLQIVPHDHVALLQLGHQRLDHIARERLAIRRPREGDGCDYLGGPQTDNERHVLPRSRGRGLHPRTGRRTRIRSVQRCGRPGFIDKNQVRRIDMGHLLIEGLAESLHTRRVALLGMVALFLARDPVFFQDAGDGAEVAGDTQAFTQLGEGSVGLVGDQLEQAFDSEGIKFRRGAASMGRWLERSRAAMGAIPAFPEESPAFRAFWEERVPHSAG